MIRTRKCLRKLITERSYFFIDLYQHYKNGVLPVNGGLFDQPAVFVDAMQIIERAQYG